MSYKTFESLTGIRVPHWKRWFCSGCCGVLPESQSPLVYRTVKVRSRIKTNSSDLDAEIAEEERLKRQAQNRIKRQAVRFDPSELIPCIDIYADERREPYASSPSFVREGLRTSVASSAASGESFSSVSASDTLDESDVSASQTNKSRSSSLSALGVSPCPLIVVRLNC